MEKEEHSVELLKNFNQGDEHEATVELGSTVEGDENSNEWLKNFNQEAEQEITVECKTTLEEEAIDNMDLVDLCEDMEALEKRVKMQRHLIEKVKLEIYGEKMKQSILQEESHPVDHLEKEIEEIKRLMLEETQEVVIR
jgi:hypothetical protein